MFIYQESLNDARSTKCKIHFKIFNLFQNNAISLTHLLSEYFVCIS